MYIKFRKFWKKKDELSSIIILEIIDSKGNGYLNV